MFSFLVEHKEHLEIQEIIEQSCTSFYADQHALLTYSSVAKDCQPISSQDDRYFIVFDGEYIIAKETKRLILLLNIKGILVL